MLRPEFNRARGRCTWPTALTPRADTMTGEVFRRRKHDPSRPNEYVQVGMRCSSAKTPPQHAEVCPDRPPRYGNLPVRAVTGE